VDGLKALRRPSGFLRTLAFEALVHLPQFKNRPVAAVTQDGRQAKGIMVEFPAFDAAQEVNAEIS
jgi:hypothetical protein